MDNVRFLVSHWWLHWQVCHGQTSVSWSYSPLQLHMSSCHLHRSWEHSLPGWLTPWMGTQGEPDLYWWSMWFHWSCLSAWHFGAAEQIWAAAEGCLSSPPKAKSEELQRHLPAPPPPGNAHSRKPTHTSLWWPCRVGLCDDLWGSFSALGE